jgi:thermostable 8-oxoguanine DNA glycosylase
MEESERRSEEKKNEIRQIPQDSLDLQMLTLNTEWGRENIPKELKDKLSKISYKFGKSKAKMIVENFEAIKEFAEEEDEE